MNFEESIESARVTYGHGFVVDQEETRLKVMGVGFINLEHLSAQSTHF